MGETVISGITQAAVAGGDPEDWTWEYNGLTFGGGTDYGLMKVEGFNPPDIRMEDIDKMEDHGAFIFGKYYESRAITFEGDVYGQHLVDFADKINTLRSTFLPQEDNLPLICKLPDESKRRIYCRPRRLHFDLDNKGYDLGLAKWAAELRAEDPRIYSNEENSEAAGVATAETIPFSIEFSIDFGGGSGGIVSVTNAGIFNSPPVVSISGPATNPRVIKLDTNEKVQANVVVPSGSLLVFDFAAKTVKLDGSSRYSTFTSDSTWWTLEPGSQSLYYVADSATGSSAVITWRDAWV